MDNPENLSIARLGLALLDRLPPRQQGGHVVLITSALAGEGKSFVARQLACSMTQPAERQAALVAIGEGGEALRRDALFRPAELALSIDKLRTRHALTLVDGLRLAECGALLQQADALLLVVDARRTPPQAVQRAMRLAGVDAGRFAGAVLNHAPDEALGR